MNGKQSKIQMIKMEMAVKDGIIAALVRIITDNKIKLPPKIISMLEAFYVKKKNEKETAQ